MATQDRCAARGSDEVTIRFAPPLVIDEEQIDWLVEKIGEALA